MNGMRGRIAVFAMAAAGVGLLAAALALLDHLGRDYVVDALAPIANFACRREDAPTPASKAPNRSQLDAPLGSVFIAGIAPSASAC